MGKAALPDDLFMREFRLLGATAMAKKYAIRERDVYKRRRRLEATHDLTLAAPTTHAVSYPGQVDLELRNGTILVGSDLHIWPDEPSTCLRAFKKFVDDIKPDVIVLNGDVMDFPRISRHPQNWEKAPDPQEEIDAASDHLHDMVQRCKRGAKKIWTIGNHDQRFETAVANALPQFRGVKGVHLADHFALWQKAMSCRVNDAVESGRTVIKHRLTGGAHATYNNIKKAGTHIVTGHLHAQNVRCVSDYRSFDLYGVDTGCIADKQHRAFTYTENNPVDWRAGFALLTFRDWRLMCPELITKWSDGEVTFRGQVIKV